VDALSHVLWLGGPSASGKSTVGRLARRNGLRWYSCDTRTWVHRDRTVADGHPGVIQWAAMTVDERQAAQGPGQNRGWGLRTVETALRNGRHVEQQVDDAGGLKLTACAPLDEVVTEVEERFAPPARRAEGAERQRTASPAAVWQPVDHQAVQRSRLVSSRSGNDREGVRLRMRAPHCDATVKRTIASFAAVPDDSSPPILADGHTTG
jgi:hypothetical protein